MYDNLNLYLNMLIYLITNLVNGKRYIGQTIHSAESRLRQHAWPSSVRGNPISRAIQKYGIERFSIEVLCSCSSREELDIKEMELIASYKTLSPEGYNLKTGGNHSEYSDEARQRMSDAKKNGFVPWNKGKTKQDDSRIAKQGAKGSANPRYGKIGTMNGRIMSTESRLNISKSKSGRIPIRTEKSIAGRIRGAIKASHLILCNENTTLYTSIKHAQDTLGLYSGSISKHLDGKLAYVKGYTFKRV